ncbi:SGNH/GDSL hydrolase family protein [Goodfellowiella coeruleoviolacea]|uniref:Lysophospholipase L1 n=1 Tax=Goodfellowiella coeruleoviolacea TaxID=334858 RepID=A0AAE3GFH3_9PSEU|nr:SGNH/GDSL hydrolase family protein [Goodfellowiella coeruleoviolacea]MCP2166404.1 Lysophospholipase L1 [Goodfellowiella coeruleoviolacea]
MLRVRQMVGAFVGALAAVVPSVLLGGVAAAAPAPVDYVALGDSYASGTGTGQYDSGSGNCKRSPRAYAALWSSTHDVSSFAFAACSGATTADVLANQVSALSAATDLVTLSIGGNDAGFGEVVTTCTLGSDQDCATAVADKQQFINAELPALLDQTYRAVDAAAPSARVVVLGYPRLFESGSCFGGLSQTKRTTLNQAADLLNTVVQQRVGTAGFEFLDVRPAFAGHGICASSAWINGLTFPLGDSYHPNTNGHRNGFLPALTSLIG